MSLNTARTARPIFLLATIALITTALSVAELTVDQAWASIASYKVGDDRSGALLLEAHIAEASSNKRQRAKNAQRLVDIMLDDSTTDDARAFVCGQLARVGSDKDVASIAKLLAGSPRDVQSACNALVVMGTPKARVTLRALLQALQHGALHEQGLDTLGAVAGPKEIEIIQALGALREAEATPVIARYLASTYGDARPTAAWALAEIGTPEAAKALETIADDPTITNARLRCAQQLARDGNTEEAGAIYASIWKGDSPDHTRAAALRGLVETDANDAPAVVFEAIGSENARLAGEAANLLPSVLGAAKNALGDFDELPVATQARVIGALAAANDKRALPLAAKRLETEDNTLRDTSISAIGSLGDASHVKSLSALLADKETKAAATDALTRLVAVGADDMILGGIGRGPLATREALIEIAAQRNSEGLARTLQSVIDDSPKLRRAAFRALGKVADADDYDALVALIETELTDGDWTALEAAIVDVARRVEDSDARLAPLLKAMDGEAKLSALRVLGRIGDVNSLPAIRRALGSDDEETRKEAIRALSSWFGPETIDDLLALVGEDDPFTQTLAARGLMRLVDRKIAPAKRQGKIIDQLIKTSNDKAVKDWARKRSRATATGQTGDVALMPDAKRSAARKTELAKTMTDGYRLVAYIDCGPDKRDGDKGKPSISVANGKTFVWSAALPSDVYGATIAFADGGLNLNASNLNPKKSYRLGLVWWDHDANGRVQSVEIAGKEVLPPTGLPNFRKDKQKAATVVIDVPGEAYQSGVVEFTLRQNGRSNIVVCEAWLAESDAAPIVAKAAPPKPRDPNAKRVLLLTGEDIKSHRWIVTAPALRTELLKDERLAVDFHDDLASLSSLDLSVYDAVVMHFKNAKPDVPGRAGFDNLAGYVKNGGGLVLVHFACGAFQECKDDFLPVAGRVWNPKLRGHDPFGTFQVDMTDTKHPITDGLEAFETTDELYTCLDGDIDVTLLATAVSKVDKKTYPMAFIHQHGKGRVFHCVLGHNVGALTNPPVAELYRRGTAWACGIDAVRPKAK